MKILVLQGKSYSGKTTALKYLMKLLEKEGFKVDKLQAEVYAGNKRTKQRDEMATAEINGTKVGICTGGETAAMLSGAFRDLVTREKCKMIVCPAYTGGETVDFLEKRNPGKDTIIYYGKAYTAKTSEQANLNSTQMVYLMSEICRYCAN